MATLLRVVDFTNILQCKIIYFVNTKITVENWGVPLIVKHLLP